MANQPSFIPSAWAANNSTTETIPATTTESGKASWDQGFPVETSLPLSEGGIPPKYGDFNGILNVLSQFCLFTQAGGQFTWSSTLSYSVGSIVVGSDGSIYRAVQATTNVNPVGDTSGKWERIVSKSDIDALESDIQTAMTNAANAVANASAAQSAVSTLDANVVKLSGDQTVGGAKTFTSHITMSGAGANTIRRTDDNAATYICGATSISNGACLTLSGKDRSTNAGNFSLRALGSTYKDLIGKPDGTLTWDSKEFVYTSGNQTIAGNKTFSASPYYNLDQIFKFAFAHGTNPSAWTHRTISFSDNSGSEATEKIFGLIRSSIGTNGATRLQISAVQNVNTSPEAATLDVNATADGIIYATCPLIRPVNNNEFSCGSPTYKWTQVYATSGTINTSDERLKSSISAVPDAVLDAWGDVQWSQFQYNDAVAEKGIDKARLHNGLIAQRIDTVFKAHGLDASRYGLFCYDAWDAVPEEKDEDGDVVIPATEAGDAYSLRYEEALCMEAAYQRRRADRADARITALEQRLAEMEAVLASLISPVGDETYAEPEQADEAHDEVTE